MKEKSIKINAVLNVIKTISSIIFPLITFPYISRVLMPDNVGKVNFGSSFVSYFSLIASLGITTYAIRECSAKRKNKEKLSRTASQIFSINVITTIIAYVSMAIILLLFRNLDSYRTLIIIQSTAILFATLGCDWLNSAMEDFAFITVRTIAFQIISLVLMFAFVRKPSDYITYAAITVLSSSGANIINIFYRKKYCTVRFVRQMNLKRHFKPILLLFVMLLVQTIFNSADVTMLGLMKGDYEVGLYSIAVKITNLVCQLVNSILWVVLPQLTKLFIDEDFERINGMLRKIFQGFISLGFPCAVGSICLANEIVVVVGGQEYKNAATSLIILMVGFVFNLLGGSFLGNMILLPSNREAVFMNICTIATLINVILNFILIPKLGAVAASITTTFSYLVMLILCIITVDKRIQLKGIKNSITSSIVGCFVVIILCGVIKGLFYREITIIMLGILSSVVFYLLTQVIMKNEFVCEIINSINHRKKS